MKKLIALFLITFLQIGCTSKVIIAPDKLPDATVGELYYTEIKISGGTSAVRSIYTAVTPNVLSVQGNHKDGWTDYNNLIIKGIPDVTGDISVKITGDTAPTLFNTKPNFEKTYVIKVKDAEK